MSNEKNLIDLIEKFDKQNMIKFTRRFVDDLEGSFNTEIGIEQDLDWSGVLCLGMGGSGAGGDFLKSIADYSAGIPFVVWKDYGLPPWWGSDWLVIATSYSGNTEETLDGVSIALEQGGTVIGVTSGGKLEELLLQNDDSICLSVPDGQMPRSAFGHLFGTQMAICWALGIFQKPSDEEINNLLARLRIMSSKADIIEGDGMPVSMAKSMLGKQIGVISPTLLSSAANRFVCQLNENSERFARQVNFPEMNHNEVVAWGSANKTNHSDIYFSWEGLNEKNKSRLDWMIEEISSDSSWIIDCEGNTLLECLLYTAHITDWVSIALALLEGKNPSDMGPIISLKKHLSSI
jgi:glucose/mannose-6-phosphate isomerase